MSALALETVGGRLQLAERARPKAEGRKSESQLNGGPQIIALGRQLLSATWPKQSEWSSPVQESRQSKLIRLSLSLLYCFSPKWRRKSRLEFYGLGEPVSLAS